MGRRILGNVPSLQSEEIGGDFDFFRPGFAVRLEVCCLDGFYQQHSLEATGKKVGRKVILR